MIIFFAPLIALLTTKIRSYTMLLVGTLVLRLRILMLYARFLGLGHR